MFSGLGTKKQWLVLVAIAALAAFVVACGTDDETKSTSNDGNTGVGAQPTQGSSGGGDVVVTPPVIPGDQGNPPPVDPGFEVVEVLAPIESVQILVLESFPEQYVVQIISGLPSGCASFSHTEVSQDGTAIKILVYNTVPAPGELIACTEIYGMHEENVALGSDFERGVQYTVMVNDHDAGFFNSGVAGSIPVDPIPPAGSLPPIGDGPDFLVEPAPVETLEIIIGQDSRGITTYYAHVIAGLTNGCKELIDPNVVRSSRLGFEIYPVVKAPKGDVACTDDYRLDSVEVELGVVGEELNACAVYTVTAGKKSTEFQAIAPNVRCADPGESTPIPVPPSGGGNIIAASHALELSLEANGADVERGGQSDFSKLFGLLPSEIKVNGVAVQVYEFAPGSSAESASDSVSLDGSTITSSNGTVMTVNWIASPHFYLFGNSIILYVGDDTEIGNLLSSVAGQFAGSEFEGTGTDTGDTGDQDSEFKVQLAQIEKVSIASTRSIPAQHMINVTMALGGSCETFNSIDWHVEERTVFINVITQVPTAPVPCTLAIIYEDQSINIGSEFEAGVEYDVVVNAERQGTFFGG